MIERRLILTGLIFISLGIILGAATSHSLQKLGIEEQQIHSFFIGTTYLIYNGLGLMTLAGATRFFDFKFLLQYRFIVIGTILFSFSIFFRVLLPTIGIDSSFLTYLTPTGGLFLIAGWVGMVIKLIRTIA